MRLDDGGGATTVVLLDHELWAICGRAAFGFSEIGIECADWEPRPADLMMESGGAGADANDWRFVYGAATINGCGDG